LNGCLSHVFIGIGSEFVDTFGEADRVSARSKSGNEVRFDFGGSDGEFSGELTAHEKLIVRGTGRVSGKVRYGRLIVADGGEVSGDVQRIDSAADAPVKTSAPIARPQLSPQPPG